MSEEHDLHDDVAAWDELAAFWRSTGQVVYDRQAGRTGLWTCTIEGEPIHPRDDHTPVQRLAQALDRVSAELRELIEEQHPVVRQCS